MISSFKGTFPMLTHKETINFVDLRYIDFQMLAMKVSKSYIYDLLHNFNISLSNT